MEEVSEELAQVGVVGLVVEPQGAAEVEVCRELGWGGGGSQEATVRRTPLRASAAAAPVPGTHCPCHSANLRGNYEAHSLPPV